MADTNKDEVLAQFQAITGSDSERAQFYLESANWQIDLAMASFYEGDEGGADMEQAAAPAPAQAPPSQPQPGGKINFGTMDVSDSDEEEEGQEFYAGGSSHSGNVILGPKKKKDGKFDIENMFKAAREAGAEEVAPGSMPGSSRAGVKAFQGGGFKLGSDEKPSQAVGVHGAGAQSPAEERHFVIKMWQEGFSIDDGDLRKYDDPANRQFLESVMRGNIPPELVKEAKGGEVHVDMEDHRQEEFVKAKVKAKPFQGAGNVLGSIVPAVEAPKASSSSDPKQAEDEAQKVLKVDSSQPVANIQVRLADGSRLIVKLNHSHTVANLRTYITTARPQYAGTLFSLLTTFPNKELTEEGQSLKDANLIGAAVLQRMK